MGGSCDALVPPVGYDFDYNRSDASDEHVGPMSDSSGDEESTVCPDDQSIDVAIDDLTLDTGSGGKTAVPTVSPVDAQPPDEDDLSNRIPGVEDVLRCVRQLLKWIWTTRRITRSSAPLRMVKEMS